MADKAAQQNIIAIDLLRAMAALSVFYYHMHIGAMMAKYSGLAFFKITDAFGAIYAVPLFFLLSGYCIHASNIKHLKNKNPLPIRQYFTRRFLRIYPPYFAALLIALLINYITVPNYSVSQPDFLVHLFALQGFTVAYFNSINVVLWTISVEIAFYIIYPLFYFIRSRYSLNRALGLALLVSCISITYFTCKGNITLPERFCVFNLWFAWCCGAFLADKKMLNPDDLKRTVYLLFYLIVIIAFVYLNYFPNNVPIIFDQFNVLIFTAPMMFLLSQEKWLRERQNVWIIKIAAAVGLSSYSLYLLHEPLIALKNFCALEFMPSKFRLAGEFIGIFIIPFITWFSYLYIEKPFMKKNSALKNV